MPADNQKDEYLDTSANMRTFVNMRFAQLTLFIAITAGLVTTILERAQTISPTASITLKVSGLLIAMIFWIMEERAADFFHYYKRRAVELEKDLGFRQYTDRPQRHLFSATNAVRLLFLGVVLFWIFLLVRPSEF